MPPNTGRKTGIARRRQQVADLYVREYTQMEIAEQLKVSPSTICVDLQHIRDQWRESAVRDFDAAREMELRKLARIEREAWAACERSPEAKPGHR